MFVFCASPTRPLPPCHQPCSGKSSSFIALFLTSQPLVSSMALELRLQGTPRLPSRKYMIKCNLIRMRNSEQHLKTEQSVLITRALQKAHEQTKTHFYSLGRNVAEWMIDCFIEPFKNQRPNLTCTIMKGNVDRNDDGVHQNDCLCSKNGQLCIKVHKVRHGK